jgi:hypothetical protein
VALGISDFDIEFVAVVALGTDIDELFAVSVNALDQKLDFDFLLKALAQLASALNHAGRGKFGDCGVRVSVHFFS